MSQFSQEQMDAIVRGVPDGPGNIQDVYALTPSQEGLWLSDLKNGPENEILSALFEVRSYPRLRELISALEKVIDRHDVLRTEVLWEGLSTPLQVVCRHRPLLIQKLVLDVERDIKEQLYERMKRGFDGVRVGRAPLLWLEFAADPRASHWYAFLKVHHVICDHQSFRAVISETFSFLIGRQNELPVPIQFRAYVEQAIESTETCSMERLYRSKFGDIDESTAPFWVYETIQDVSQHQEAHRRLDSDLAYQVRTQSRHFKMSAAELIHTAWALVVAGTSGRDDVVYGAVVPIVHRAVRGKSPLGFLVNVLPMRLRLEHVTSEELLLQTQRQLVELASEAELLSAAQQHCWSRGDPRLFTSLLNVRPSVTDSEIEADGPEGIRVLGTWEGWTSYPLQMTVDEQGEVFSLTIMADRRIGAQRMMNYLCTGLESLVKALERAPQTSAAALSILPEAERRDLTELFNATCSRESRSELIHELFERQVNRSSDAVAVVNEGQSLTYRELNSKANQLARYLRNRGVGPDRLVAICLERSIELLVGLLGVLKAGGGYVPLDPSNPKDRLEYILSDSAPLVLLTRECLRNTLPRSAAKVITVDHDWAEIAKEELGNLNTQSMGLCSKHLAYVIYTSGTTGRPKGVMIEHRNIVNYSVHAARHLGVEAGNGSLVCTSFGFDLMLTGLYPTLLCGQTVRLCRERHGIPALEDELLKCDRLAPLKLTPSHLALLDQPLRSGRLAGSVQTLVVGGERLSASAVQTWQKYAPCTRIFNHYGPTETTVGCAMHEVVGPVDGEIPLGRPISNTQIYVLDRRGRPVPVGVAGEIHIGGAGVARGYLNRPALTSERFVADPLSTESQARMYKTGDLGRWRSDGAVEYLGRNDHQVKIRGFRIELGEIEWQFLRHAAVKEAVVLVRDNVQGERHLVAYVTQRVPGASHAELQAHLRVMLPEYMVPSAIVILNSFPLTPNGKLNRGALPAPGRDAYSGQEYEQPRGDVEKSLAQIWQELLGVDQIGRQDDFFALGGDSLMTMPLTARISEKFPVQLHVHAVFENSTFCKMAQLIDKMVSEQQGKFVSESDVEEIVI